MAKEVIENAELMNTNAGNKVVLANDLIAGKTALSLNASKLLRTAIMQIKYEDEEIKPYKLSIDDFGEMIGTTGDSLYKSLDRITDELMYKKIFIKDRVTPKKKWVKLNWCSKCVYSDGYIYIYLNNQLKPYLIGLRKLYTQYPLENILTFKSAYSVKLYELIMMGLHNVPVIKPYQIIDIEIMLDTLRIATETENMYPDMCDFKKRVIVPALKDINSIAYKTAPYLSGLIVSYDTMKKGKRVIGFVFHVTSHSAQNPLPPEKQKQIDDFKERMKEKERRKREQIKGQMDIEDYEQMFKLSGED